MRDDVDNTDAREARVVRRKSASGDAGDIDISRSGAGNFIARRLFVALVHVDSVVFGVVVPLVMAVVVAAVVVVVVVDSVSLMSESIVSISPLTAATSMALMSTIWFVNVDVI